MSGVTAFLNPSLRLQDKEFPKLVPGSQSVRDVLDDDFPDPLDLDDPFQFTILCCPRGKNSEI